MSQDKTGQRTCPSNRRSCAGDGVNAPILTMDQFDYQRTVSGALKSAFGRERHGAKKLAGAAGTNVSTAKNWLGERSTPQGLHLLRLMATVPEMASAIRHLTAMTDTDPEFARDFMRAMQTFQRVQEMRNAAMAMDAGDVGGGDDAAQARPDGEPTRGRRDALDDAPRPMVEPPR